MSDDPSPPDLTETAEFPLDELSPKPKDSVVDHPPVDHPKTLFNDAQPLGLSQTRLPAGLSAGEKILERAERPLTDRLNPTRSIERFRGFLATSRDHAEPLYRRQGTLAVAGLCLLSVLVAVSFPRTRATLGSGLEVVTNDAPDPAAPAGSLGGAPDNTLDPIGSESLFTGSKADEGQDRSKKPTRTVSTTRRGSSTAAATEPAIGGSQQLPTFAELTETTVPVGPGPTICDGPGAPPPGCEAPTTRSSTAPESSVVSSSTTTGETKPTVGEQSSTTSPTAGASSTSSTTTAPTTTPTTATPSTTAKPTTTKKPTTTAKPITTKKPTTTAKPTTTTKPTTTAEPTTTKKPTTTTKPTTTKKPTTTATTTSTTRPSSSVTTVATTSTTSGGPGEGSSTPPTFVQCTPRGEPPCP